MPDFAKQHNHQLASEIASDPQQKSTPREPREGECAADAGGMQTPISDACALAAAALAVSDDTRITDAQFRVFALIAKGYCRRSDMAAQMKKSVATVARAIDALVKLRLIERETVPGKASKLRVSPTIIAATRIMGGAATRITGAAGCTSEPTTRVADEPTEPTRITHDTTTRVTGDATTPNDTGRAGDNSAAPCIGTGAHAQKLTLNTTASDQIRSDRVVTQAEIKALIERAGVACANGAPGLIHGADINRLLRGGCDFEQDIIPAVDKLAASFIRRGKKLRTWELLEEHAIDFRDRRLAGIPAPKAINDAPAFRQQRSTYGRGAYGANGISRLVAVG